MNPCTLPTYVSQQSELIPHHHHHNDIKLTGSHHSNAKCTHTIMTAQKPILADLPSSAPLALYGWACWCYPVSIQRQTGPDVVSACLLLFPFQNMEWEMESAWLQNTRAGEKNSHVRSERRHKEAVP